MRDDRAIVRLQAETADSSTGRSFVTCYFKTAAATFGISQTIFSYIAKKTALFYSFLKVLVRLFRPLFFRSVRINRPDLLRVKGPLLISANHPDSFLDAVLLDSLFAQPIWSLARGDVFKNKFITRILTAIKILPVYRVSEGVENLSTNYETFDSCKEIFQKQGLVLIFSEGICVNEWHLRPLKKGTARLAISSWRDEIPLSILPVGINYNSFTRFGKEVIINIGEPIALSEFTLTGNEGKNIQLFNELLTRRLQPLVFEIDRNDEKTKTELFERPPSLFKKIILTIPAVFGWLLHQPLYVPIRRFAVKKAYHTGHYDSVLAALLFITYPFFLAIVALILFIFTGKAVLVLLVMVLPLLGWCYLQHGSSGKGRQV